jgi:hypothetical protein
VFSTLSVIGLRRLTIYNFYLTNVFCVLNGTHQKMPPKRSTRANPKGKEDSNIQPLSFITPAQARKTTRKTKLVQNKVPAIATPLKSQVKKVTPAAKKKTVQVGAKKLCAVMNVKTGAVRELTSTKTGMNFRCMFCWGQHDTRTFDGHCSHQKRRSLPQCFPSTTLRCTFEHTLACIRTHDSTTRECVSMGRENLLKLHEITYFKRHNFCSLYFFSLNHRVTYAA